MPITDIFRKGKGNNSTSLTNKEKKMTLRVIRRQESIVRKDIADWKAARYEATRTEQPRQHLLQTLFDEIMLDAKMDSQISLRIAKSQATDFDLKDANGNTNEEATAKLADSGLFDKLARYIVESVFYSQSVCEFSIDKQGTCDVNLVPRANIAPRTGLFYPDVYGDTSEAYRLRPDFGKFIVEFCTDRESLGKLNKAVPYVLMKKFALSCWSELCEIYGIPPRVLKTNTTDEQMLSRAENMMREIGSAAYFIIDTEEDFQFANAASTNGDVYKNFIATCDEQISLLNLGAVLGQDTLNGNRSKEEASAELTDDIVDADRRMIQLYMNGTVLPALASIGFIPQGLRFEFAKATDVAKLWQMVNQAAPYYEFDIDWLRTTFGMEITGARSPMAADQGKEEKFNFFG